jgi:hypothetical protein
MQICQDHWHELKNAIRQRGMWKLVSPQTSRQLPEHVTMQMLTATRTGSALDPLNMATLMISDQALMAFGEYLETRSYCPLCEVEQNLGRGQSFEWIDVDADAVLEVCRERNLVSGE